jgi:hypothetical protein
MLPSSLLLRIGVFLGLHACIIIGAVALLD